MRKGFQACGNLSTKKVLDSERFFLTEIRMPLYCLHRVKAAQSKIKMLPPIKGDTMKQVNDQELAEMMRAGINGNVSVKLMEMSNEGLEELVKAANTLLAIRKPKNLVTIEWDGTVGDIRKGKPYFATLTNVNGKIEYKFVSTISYDSHKMNASATAVFTGELAIGTVVRHRDGASWKNDYSEYSVITAEGMKQITEIEAKKLLGIIK